MMNQAPPIDSEGAGFSINFPVTFLNEATRWGVSIVAHQKGHKESYRGGEYSVDLLPKVKFEVVVQDGVVDAAVDAILNSAGSGKIGDGKIFLYKVEEAIRIRSHERGAAVIVCRSVGQNVATTNGEAQVNPCAPPN